MPGSYNLIKARSEGRFSIARSTRSVIFVYKPSGKARHFGPLLPWSILVGRGTIRVPISSSSFAILSSRSMTWHVSPEMDRRSGNGKRERSARFSTFTIRLFSRFEFPLNTKLVEEGISFAILLSRSENLTFKNIQRNLAVQMKMNCKKNFEGSS